MAECAVCYKSLDGTGTRTAKCCEKCCVECADKWIAQGSDSGTRVACPVCNKVWKKRRSTNDETEWVLWIPMVLIAILYPVLLWLVSWDAVTVYRSTAPDASSIQMEDMYFKIALAVAIWMPLLYWGPVFLISKYCLEPDDEDIPEDEVHID